jgi:hypothetical protein
MSDPAADPIPAPRVHASLRSDYIQPNIGHALRVWWAFYWRTLVTALVLTTVATGVIRLMYQAHLISPYLAVWTAKVIPYVFFYSTAIPVMRFVLHKRFRHFRIAVWSQGGQPPSSDEKPTYNQAIRVWWAFTWRVAVYGALATTMAGFPLRFVAGLFAPSPEMSRLLEMVIGMIVQAAVALFVLYSNILDEDMADFHVGLLTNESPEQVAAEAVPTIAG